MELHQRGRLLELLLQLGGLLVSLALHDGQLLCQRLLLAGLLLLFAEKTGAPGLGLLQRSLEAGELLAKSTNVSVVVAVHIDGSVVRDLLGTLGVVEGEEAVSEGGCVRPHVHDKERLAVAAQRVLEEVGELAVAEGNLAPPGVRIREPVEDCAEDGEAGVDALRLLPHRAGRLALRQPLVACQVHQMDLANGRCCVAASWRPLDRESENSVGARGDAVLLRPGDRPAALALHDQVHGTLVARHRHVERLAAVEEHAVALSLLHLDRVPCTELLELGRQEVPTRGRVVRGVEEVGELVHVQLDVRQAHRVGRARRAGDLVVDVLHCPRNDPMVSAAHHRVRLASAGLPVGKDGAVVASNRVLDEGLHLAEHVLL
mmetsp:Transcript_10335/g.42037  ORF Transcript_10335/g.42037 Transcript_10335/m.42037 type:complete len:374 (-) Transcript_10335:422-1543(-)